MISSQNRLIYQQLLFTALRDYCLKVTGRCHVLVFPAFYEKYPVLIKSARAFGADSYVQLNLSETAIYDLKFTDVGIEFVAVFSGEHLKMSLPFDDILGLTNCRDPEIHRLSIAAVSNYEYGLDPRTIIMVDMSLNQTLAGAFNPDNQSEDEPEQEVPAPKRPALSIVK